MTNDATPASREVHAISARNPSWLLECQRRLEESPSPVQLCDIKTADQIKAVASFAAVNQLLVTCEKGAFLLSKRLTR